MIQQIITDCEALFAFEPEWSCFAHSVGHVTPFQTPLWHITWWRHFGGGDLHVLVYRNRERVAGVIPCFLHEWNGRRQMTLLGSGISDYLDPLLHPADAAPIVDALALHLNSFADWDLCNWQDLSAETPLKQLAHSSPLQLEAIADGVVSSLEFPASFDDYWSARSSDLRRNVRRYRLKAEREAPVHFVADHRPAADLIDTVIHLHGKRWGAVGQLGMVAANHSAAFLQDVTSQFAKIGRTRVFSIRYQDRIVAAIVGFVLENQFFSYMSAFDPEFEPFGFGRTILFETLRHLHASGISRFDFLRGDETYKTWWGAIPSSRCRLLITPGR